MPSPDNKAATAAAPGELAAATKDALLAEYRQLSAQLDTAARVTRELQPKRDAAAQMLRAYGINPDEAK